MSGKTCDRCGDDYDAYTVFIRDNFADLVDHVSNDYDNLCKPCRAAVAPGQAFRGADEVTPKENP